MAHRVGIVIFPRFQILNATGPISAFEIASAYRRGAYELHVLSEIAGPIGSSSGVAIVAEAFDRAPKFDTLLVVGGRGVDAAMVDPAYLGFVTTRAKKVARVVSVCSGSFILANAGLLDGRRATTHWWRTSQFTKLFPKVRLDADRIFVQDGTIWTSAGITAGIDLTLALIGADLGEDVARLVAQQLVVPHRRFGGQSQFSSLSELAPPEGRFAALLTWVRDHLDEKLSVEILADRVAMSPRHFARAFAAETGTTPAKAIERLRVEVARGSVEFGSDPIDVIARRVGFGEAERLRKTFVRAFGLSPQSMRRQARPVG